MLSNMRIGRKLALGFSGLSLVLLIMTVAITATTWELTGIARRNSVSSDAQDSISSATAAISDIGRYILAFAISGEARYRQLTIETRGQLLQQIDRTASNITADRKDLLDKLASVRTSVADWNATYVEQQIKRMDQTNARDEIESAFRANSSLTTNLLVVIRDARKAVTVWSSQEDQNEKAGFQTLFYTLGLGTALALLCAGIAGWVITRSITKPIGTTLDAMTKLAKGDTAIEIPAIARRDEVGDISRAVQVFKDAAIHKLQMEQDAEEHRHAAEQERARTSAAQQVAAEQQATVVNGLAASLARLSDGDLTCGIEQPFAPEYERLRMDFNAAITQLLDVVGTIVANSSAIRSGAGEISQAADDLSRRTEQQAASLEQTAAALDEITTTVKRTAEGANHAQKTVSQAKLDAEKSGLVVSDAVKAMSEIESSARQISQIIGVIDEIAFQTNLLALNAGVEAARAGDAGRGFAVVASEVRALAQRSAEAAKEIKSLITASSEQVGRGVRLVGETGQSLTRIVGQVGEITTIIAEIATSAHEQASGLDQVNTAVNQMDQVTQQNAAMVEQSTAASHSLSKEVDELVRLTQRFQTGVAAPVSSAARATPAITRSAERKPAVRRPKVEGNVVRMTAPSEQEWEEF